MKTDTLEGFYDWAKDIGHYRAVEAVERYRKSLTDVCHCAMCSDERRQAEKKKIHGDGTG